MVSVRIEWALRLVYSLLYLWLPLLWHCLLSIRCQPVVAACATELAQPAECYCLNGDFALYNILGFRIWFLFTLCIMWFSEMPVPFVPRNVCADEVLGIVD